MTGIDDKFTIIVGVSGKTKKLTLSKGATVQDALSEAGLNADGYELRYRMDVSLSSPIPGAGSLLLVRSVRGESTVEEHPTPIFNIWEYWRRTINDFIIKLRYVVGIFVVITEEKTVGHSLCTTWTTLATLGPLDGSPQTVLGKLLVSVDAFAGLILLGSVVWVATVSLSRR